MANGISKMNKDMEKQITIDYLEKLADEIWEVKRKEKNYRYSDREIYLDSLLDYIDRIQAVIEKGEI
jgi:hypothetical protein